jgi:hypothetical protein
MLIYNRIAEIIADQFVIIAVYEIITIGIVTFVFKKRLTIRIYFLTILLAIILSIISMVIARGNYSGTAYHERFGWPIQYYLVSRNIEVGTNIAVPYSFNFIFSKFLANTFIWLYLPVNIYTIYLNKKRTRAFIIYMSFAVIIFIGLVAGFSLFNLLYR